MIYRVIFVLGVYVYISFEVERFIRYLQWH